MKCPWLINTSVETNNRNSYNDSRRTEQQDFGKCVKGDCPFYDNTNSTCLRAKKELE